MTVSYPAKLLAASGDSGSTIYWAAGESSKTVETTLDTAGLKDGDVITLSLSDENGIGRATNHIWFVEKPVSASNPYWIGEKKDLGFGEWTMDLEAAKTLVANTSGQANTLVLLEGALWCPDCHNVEDNFLSETDGTGENRFEAWAKKNNIALVAIDTPSYTSETDYTRPTLLSRRDVRGNGVSGLGYLTRKMVGDDVAAEVLERNRLLCSRNTDNGGFHRPEDGNVYRTGVPYFVMLRKDGSVAARLTRWASVSTTVLNSGNFDAFYNRFNEMLAMAAQSGKHVDAGEMENGYPGVGAVSFTADGGTASGELSHVDSRDVFKLNGVAGNMLQKVSVEGDSSAEVTVSFLTVDGQGKAVQVGDAVTGKLSDGVVLEHEFSEAGEYYVLVASASITAAEWAVENKTAENFISYTITGNVVLVPQEKAVPVVSTSNTVVMRIEKGVFYRIQGVKPEAVSTYLQQNGDSGQFFRALVSGDVELTTLYGKNTTVTYQIWEPGVVGFDSEGRSVSENMGQVTIPFSRTGGTSGEVTVKVSIDEKNTSHTDSDGTLRYVPFEPVVVTWKDGEAFSTNVVVSLLDDLQFDGPGKIVLNLEITEQESDDVLVATPVFTLSVTDNDKSAPGVVSFVESGTVYCKATAGATVKAIRESATDGDVSVSVKTTTGKLSSDTLEWKHRDAAAKSVTLTDIPAGKSATLTLKALNGGVTVPYAGRTLRVIAVPDDGPEFDESAVTLHLSRYVNMTYLAEVDTQTFASGSKLEFSKKAGTLPPGLTAKWNGSTALQISGAPTKAGEYTATYQVSARGTKGTVAGLTTTVTFIIADPAAGGAAGEEPLNPAIATTRTFKDVMVLGDGELKGLLQLTIPATGRVSAKYVSAEETIAFSSKSWSSVDSKTGTAVATLTGTTKKTEGWSLELSAKADGAIDVSVSGPSGTEGETSFDGVVWTKNNTASAYTGYYTITLPVAKADAETTELAPTGAGYVTAKLQGTSSLQSGRVSWGGILPNGTAISGSATLTDASDVAYLPIFAKSSKDAVSGVAAIVKNAASLRDVGALYKSVTAPSFCPAVSWKHSEAAGSAASYSADLDVYGCLYDRNDDLEACCSEFFDGATNMWFVAEGSAESSIITVGRNTIAVDRRENPLGVTLGFNRTTGIASGTLKRDNKTISWKGVVLVGLGGCSACSAGADDISLPLVNGTMYYTDRLVYETKNSSGKTVTRTVSVKRGGAVKIDVEQTFE